MNIEFPTSWYRPTLPGFGTFPWPHVTPDLDYKTVARMMQSSIEEALTIGYRHLDTAFAYHNQDLVGKAVNTTGIPRKEVFVTSKLDQHSNEYDVAQEKIKEALQQIWGSDVPASDNYLDAFLLHYPGKGRPIQAWKALLQARDQGIIKHVGVSNFEIRHLEELAQKSGEYPEVNQIEFHPWIYHEQRELVTFCQDHDIAIEGYSPLAQSMALQDLTLQKIAMIHETLPARILLKWCMQHGVKPIVGSRNKNHLKINAEPYMFVLGMEEMQLLDDLGDTRKIHISKQWNWNPKTSNLGDE